MSSIFSALSRISGCLFSRPAGVKDDPPFAAPSQLPDTVASLQPLPCYPAGPAAGVALASGLRFGVEVEHQGLSFAQVSAIVGSVIVGAKVGERRVVGPDGRAWVLDKDAGGVELVTPILRGRADLELLQRIVGALAQAGGTINESAGLHVHIDGARFSPDQVLALVTLLARNEHWLYPVWGVHRKRRLCWCHALDVGAVARGVAFGASARDSLDWISEGSRYVGINLQNYLTPGGINTLEFRYLNGTLDACAIGCAVGFYMALSERALQAAGTDAARDVARSSLPRLLAELEITRMHPVGAHFYALLHRRICEGWHVEKHGAMPDIAALLQEHAFVDNLCMHMNTWDSPETLAALVARATVPGAPCRHAAVALFTD